IPFFLTAEVSRRITIALHSIHLGVSQQGDSIAREVNRHWQRQPEARKTKGVVAQNRGFANLRFLRSGLTAGRPRQGKAKIISNREAGGRTRCSGRTSCNFLG